MRGRKDRSADSVCNSLFNESIVIKSKEKFHTEFTVKVRVWESEAWSGV
jgi:hypothetical protein